MNVFVWTLFGLSILCDFAHSDNFDHTVLKNEKAAGGVAVPNQVLPSHEHASSQYKGCRCGNTAFCEAALRHTKGLMSLRGGVSHSKTQSCYPLHGEGDTEGREIGSRADPYSVASVSAAPPSAVGEIERIYMEVLRDNPNDIAVRISIHCFVAFFVVIQ
jgi:hypothetical protein